MVGHYGQHVAGINKMIDKKNIVAIETRYNLNISYISPIRESADNKVYLLKTTNKKYALRISKRNIQNDVLFEMTWLNYLLSQGIPVVEVIKTTDEKLFSLLHQSVIILFKFVQGRHMETHANKKPALKKVKNAARVLAKIHNVSYKINIGMPRKRNIFTEAKRALNIKDKLTQFSEGGNQFIKELAFYKDWAKKKDNNYYFIHNDYRPGNVFFDGDEVSTILDLDWSCKGPAIKDVAHSLIEWSFPDGGKKHWQDVFEAFLASYNHEAKDKINLDHDLYHWISFCCLSDAATYFSDLANKNTFKKITSSYMYQKFLYFERFIK